MNNHTPKNNILLAVIGKSPAVLTETIWSLVSSSPCIIPDKIVVLTTKTGSVQLSKQLFINDQWKHFKNELSERFNLNIKQKLKFGPVADCVRVIPARDRNTELDDILTVQDNESVAEYFLEIIRFYTQNKDTRIIASIAGGRKTMSSLLHSAMNLLGRRHDLVTHVLVSEPWERVQGFLYPTQNKNFKHPDTGKDIDPINAKIELASIPIFPLRYMLPESIIDSNSPYEEIIQHVLGFIDQNNKLHLEFQVAQCDVIISGKRLRLGAYEFCFYLAYASHALNNCNTPLPFKDIEPAMIQVAEEYDNVSMNNKWTQVIITTSIHCAEDARKWAHKIRQKLKALDFSEDDISKLIPNKRSMKINLNPNDIKIINPAERHT
tara:strand:- start:8 stop:1144 length:1137 start_codon:yes stop_codon:yes gene_type:complete